MILVDLFTFLHLLGVILWLGVAVALPFVTGRAAREGDPRVVAFAYGTSNRVMRTLGLAGMVLTLAGGIGLMEVNPAYGWFDLHPHWLFQMQVLGLVAVAVGIFYQLPLGGRLEEAARDSARQGEATDEFRKLRRRHAVVGSVNGLILLVLVVLGTLRP